MSFPFLSTPPCSGVAPASAETSQAPASGRRGFLVWLGGALALAGTSLELSPASAAVLRSRGEGSPGSAAVGPGVTNYRTVQLARYPSMLDQLNLQAYAAHLNTEFRLTTEGVSFTLVQAREGRGHNPSQGQECFTLLFRGPLEPALPQQLYALAHPVLGRQELFLVPVRENAEGRFYEAVFSRLVSRT